MVESESGDAIYKIVIDVPEDFPDENVSSTQKDIKDRNDITSTTSARSKPRSVSIAIEDTSRSRDKSSDKTSNKKTDQDGKRSKATKDKVPATGAGKGLSKIELAQMDNASYLQLPLPNKRVSQLSENTESTSLSSGSGSTTGSTSTIIKDAKYETNIVGVLQRHRRKKLCHLTILLSFVFFIIIVMVIVALFLAKVIKL